MKVDFKNIINKTYVGERCEFSNIPSVGDHVNIAGREWLITGRLFSLNNVDVVEIYVKPATSRDVAYM